MGGTIMTSNNNTMQVTLFGKFKLQYNDSTLTQESIRSDKVIKLFVYIISHRNHPISTQELSDILWQNEDIDNPIGALKNLVYRLRTIIKKTFGIDQCILTGRGTYAWNNAISLSVDVERFDELSKALKEQEMEDEVLLEHYRELVELYQGTYMSKHSSEHWILPISTYYHSTFLSLIKEYLKLLDEKQKYEEMEEVAKKAIDLDALEEFIHYSLIKALIGQGKQQIAIDHYKATTHMLYETLGTRPSQELQNLYNDLQKIRNNQELDLIAIQKDLDEQKAKGAFFCEYGTFKEIYRLQARMAGRLGVSMYLSLITILPNQENMDNEAYLKIVTRSMKNMKEILESSLRVGDIIARYSSSQYIVLLPTCTFENATKVMQRLLNKYYVGIKNNRTKVQYNLQELIITDEKYR